MANFDKAIETIIQNAIARGEFDNLAGKGKPLNLQENQFVDQDWKLAYSLLEQHSFVLPWMEDRTYIEETLKREKENLQRTWEWFSSRPKGDALAADEWQQAVSKFNEIGEELNKQIDRYNLSIPADVFYRPRINIEREIEEVKGK
jgi:DnaJ family protein C protein 28